MASSSSAQQVELVIKCPSSGSQENVEMQVAGSMLLHELKETLRHKYPGNPSVERITVIYAGKVLKNDTAPLSSFLLPTPDNSQFVLHVVIKPLAYPLTAASPSSSWSPSRPNASSTTPVAPSPQSSSSVATAVAHFGNPNVSTTTPGPSASSGVPSTSHITPVPDPTPPPAATVVSNSAPPTTAVEPQQQEQVPEATPAPAVSSSSTASDPSTAAPVAPNTTNTNINNQTPRVPTPSTTGYPPVSPMMMMMPPPGTPSFMPTPPSPAAYQAMFSSAYAAALQAIVEANPLTEEQLNAAGGTNAQQTPQPQPYMMPYYGMPMAYPYPPQQPQTANLRQRRRNITAQVPPGELAAVLRAARDARGQLPPALDDLLNAMDAAATNEQQRQDNDNQNRNAGAAQPRAAAGNNNNQGNVGRQFHLRIRINVRVLLQVLVLLVVLYQHCSLQRFITLICIGLVLYLTTLERVRQFMLRLTGIRLPLGQQPPGARGAAPVAGNGEPPLDGQQEPLEAAAQQPQNVFQVVIREIQTLVIGFITSLLPGWNMNEADRAALQAAQQAAAREQQEVQQGPL